MLNQKTVNKLSKVSDQLRMLQSGISFKHFDVVLYIAKHEGCSPSQVADDLGFSRSNTVKILDMFIEPQGTGIITRTVDSSNPRDRNLSLSPKGRKLFELLSDIVEG